MENGLQWVGNSRSRKNWRLKKEARWITTVSISDLGRTTSCQQQEVGMVGFAEEEDVAGWSVLFGNMANGGKTTMEILIFWLQMQCLFLCGVKFLTFSNGNYVHPNLPFISEPHNWRATTLHNGFITITNGYFCASIRKVTKSLLKGQLFLKFV